MKENQANRDCIGKIKLSVDEQEIGLKTIYGHKNTQDSKPAVKIKTASIKCSGNHLTSLWDSTLIKRSCVNCIQSKFKSFKMITFEKRIWRESLLAHSLL